MWLTGLWTGRLCQTQLERTLAIQQAWEETNNSGLIQVCGASNHRIIKAMTKKTVYLETSFISYLTARPSRDIITAAHQAISYYW